MRSAKKILGISGKAALVVWLLASTNVFAAEENEPLPHPGTYDVREPVVVGPVMPYPDEFIHSPQASDSSKVNSAETAGPCENCHSTRGCHGGTCHRGRHNGPVMRRWHGHWKPWLHENHWGYPEYFESEPHGASIHAHFNAQVGNAQAAQLALYHFDFHDGPGMKAAKLNSYGVDRLRQLSSLLMHSGLPLVVQRSQNNVQLDEARRAEVINQLAKMSPVAIAAERVIVGRPIALGLDGRESSLIYLNLLKQTTRGEGFRPGSSSSGGFTPTQGFTPFGR